MSSFNLRKPNPTAMPVPRHPKLQANAFALPLEHWENLALDFMGHDDWLNAAHAWHKAQAACQHPIRKQGYGEKAQLCLRHHRAPQ